MSKTKVLSQAGSQRIQEQEPVVRQSPMAIAACTDTLLQAHVAYCHTHSPFYRQQLNAVGVTPQDIQRVTDLAKLPFTTKADLAEQGASFLAVASEAVVDVCQTSGTTGAPVGLLQTELDLQRLAYNEYQCFQAAGLTATDRVVVACAIDRCFMAGLAYFEGLRRLGACAVRVGAGSPAVLGEALRTYRPTAVVGVPSVLLATAGWLQQQGVEPAGLGIQKMICIGEPIRDSDLSLLQLGQRLNETWQTIPLGTYASTEMATSFAECIEGQAGGHILPDLLAIEILDENDQPVAAGVAGELIATPLQVTGMPLLRLRTGDIVTRRTDPCVCGRLTDRLGPVVGRRAQMLKIRGTTVYPTAIFAVLQGIHDVNNYAVEIHDDFDLSDRVEVLVSLHAGTAVTADQIVTRLQGRLRVKVPVRVLPGEELRKRMHVESKRKPVRVFDERKRNLKLET